MCARESRLDYLFLYTHVNLHMWRLLFAAPVSASSVQRHNGRSFTFRSIALDGSSDYGNVNHSYFLRHCGVWLCKLQAGCSQTNRKYFIQCFQTDANFMTARFFFHFYSFQRLRRDFGTIVVFPIALFKCVAHLHVSNIPSSSAVFSAGHFSNLKNAYYSHHITHQRSCVRKATTITSLLLLFISRDCNGSNNNYTIEMTQFIFVDWLCSASTVKWQRELHSKRAHHRFRPRRRRWRHTTHQRLVVRVM